MRADVTTSAECSERATRKPEHARRPSSVAASTSTVADATADTVESVIRAGSARVEGAGSGGGAGSPLAR